MATKGTNSKPSTTKKPTTSGAKKPTTTKKTGNQKPVPTVKKEVNRNTPPVKKQPARKKPAKTTNKEQVKKEIVQAVEKDFNKGGKKKGKFFYLAFSVIFFVAAFFYINNTLFNNNDYMQSALFAFAALFVVFVLLQFNVHMIFINFFRLPIKLMVENSRIEISTRKESKFSFGKYRFTIGLTLNALFLGLIVGSNIYNDFMNETPILSIITSSFVIIVIFLVIVCSWQYLFNIIPNILDKSIDAKNGFILTLSAAVMIIFVLFRIFDINYLNSVMIFILLIGFIALLGVNLNMIVGEINIFQNLRNRHSKTVTRVVFLIFFSFHLYVIVYASVVAFSIYNADASAYNFSNTKYETMLVEEIYSHNQLVTSLQNTSNMPIEAIYDVDGEEITTFYDDENKPLYKLYDESNMPNGDIYDEFGFNLEFYDQNAMWLSMVTDEDGNMLFDLHYADGNVYGYYNEEVPYEYGTFLYYTVVTISTLGYGDITPNITNNIAMFWGGFLSIYGFTFFALSIGFVSNIAIENATRKDDET